MEVCATSYEKEISSLFSAKHRLSVGETVTLTCDLYTSVTLDRYLYSISGNVEKICGIDCLLVHGPSQVTDEAEWAFYGHGLTDETWSPDKNDVKKGKCRFNAIWNFSLAV